MPRIPANSTNVALVKACIDKFVDVENIDLNNPNNNPPFTPNTVSEIFDCNDFVDWANEMKNNNVAKIGVSFGYYIRDFVQNADLKAISGESDTVFAAREGRLTGFLIPMDSNHQQIDDKDMYNVGSLEP